MVTTDRRATITDNAHKVGVDQSRQSFAKK
jgi:hypothetical protein